MDGIRISAKASACISDSMKRFHELKGEDTYLLTGTDEHGQKIQEKAEEAGITTTG